jgi:hypothetical protein
MRRFLPMEAPLVRTLTDDACSSRYKTGSSAMESLKIKLVFARERHEALAGSQYRFGNRFRIEIVILERSCAEGIDSC